MPAWDTIVFSASIAVGCVLVLGSALGAADLDGATASLDHDALGDADADVEVDVDADADADAHGGSLQALGVGRVPLVIGITLFCFFFGGAGLIAEPFLHASLGPVLGGFASLAAASLVALPVTSRSCHWLARVMPRHESYAGSKQDLVGRVAHVVVSGRSEVVLRVTDAGGAEQRVVALAPTGLRLASGALVYLVAYDAQRDRFVLERSHSG